MDLLKGKLYKCLEYSLLIFPSKEKAEQAAVAAAVGGVWMTVYWSKQLNCQIRHSKPGEVFMVLKTDGDFAQVLFGEKIGWVNNKVWLGIEKVNNGK